MSASSLMDAEKFCQLYTPANPTAVVMKNGLLIMRKILLFLKLRTPSMKDKHPSAMKR